MKKSQSAPQNSGSNCQGDNSMKILALDTSTPMATVAVSNGDRIVAESLFSSDRTLSARLIPEIERLLEMAGFTIADIDLFASSVGPGSFTGVRGGVATIQGLALACGKPCAGFSSLALLAMNFACSAYPVCTMLDARKNEVYAALYAPFKQLPAVLVPDVVMSAQNFLELVCQTTVQPVIFAGDGALRYAPLISEFMAEKAIFPSFPLHSAHAGNGIMLALERLRNGDAVEPARLLPVYLRASDAELMKKGAPKL